MSLSISLSEFLPFFLSWPFKLGGNWNSASPLPSACVCLPAARYPWSSLATDTEYVRGRLAQYGNDLLSLGVDGFRLDAAKRVYFSRNSSAENNKVAETISRRYAHRRYCKYLEQVIEATVHYTRSHLWCRRTDSTFRVHFKWRCAGVSVHPAACSQN